MWSWEKGPRHPRFFGQLIPAVWKEATNRILRVHTITRSLSHMRKIKHTCPLLYGPFYATKLCQWGSNYLIVACFETRGRFKTGRPLDLWGRGARSPSLRSQLSWEAFNHSGRKRLAKCCKWPAQCMTKKLPLCKRKNTFWGSSCGSGWELASVLLTCSQHVCCKFQWGCYHSLPQMSGQGLT